MNDTIQLENTVTSLRNDLQSIAQRIEVFELLPVQVRTPILDNIANSLQLLKTHVAGIRADIEREVAKQRGDDVEDYRKAFRQAT